MSRYLCHQCGVSSDDFLIENSIDLSGKTYTFEEFLKHLLSHDRSCPVPRYDAISKDPAYEIYKDWRVTSSVSGCVEMDAYNTEGRIIFYLWSDAGITFEMGRPLCNGETVKFVFDENDTAVRIDPVTPGRHINTTDCENCCVSGVAY